MSFEELLFAPQQKNIKQDANFKKIEQLALEINTYIEVNTPDDQLWVELGNFAEKIVNIVGSDLTTKDKDILKLEFEIKKSFREFEKRDSLTKPSNIQKKSGGTSVESTQFPKLVKVTYGSPIHELPDRTSNKIGFAKDTVLILQSEENDFYKVELNGRQGYIHKGWLSKDWIG